MSDKINLTPIAEGLNQEEHDKFWETLMIGGGKEKALTDLDDGRKKTFNKMMGGVE